MHSVIETESFMHAAEATGLSDDERYRIINYISEYPEAGDIMPGTGGARKLRFPFKGKGKSGGVRVITYYGGEDIPVFLLDIFSKGERVNLSKAECNVLRKTLGEMVDVYREVNRKKLAEMKEKSA